jgi:AcrR family transcriptional regulator
MSDTDAKTPRRMAPEQRRAQLVEAAMASAAARGYAGLSLDDVSERAGVTRNLRYPYFPRGRLDLYLAALERAGEELTGDFIVDPEQSLAERLAANTERAIQHAARASDAWLVWRHARSAAEPEILAVRDRYRDELVTGMSLNFLGTGDPPRLARVALRAYLDFHETALDEWRGSGLDRAALLALLEHTLTATVEAMTA